MKLKSVFLCTLAVFIFIFLASCAAGGGSGGTETPEKGEQEVGDLIIDSKTVPDLIYRDWLVPSSYVEKISKEVERITGVDPESATQSSYYDFRSGRGIAIGMTDLEISEKAMTELEKVERSGEYSAAFLIYASEGSVAIVFDNDVGGVALSSAIAYFVDNYLSGKSLSLEPGVVYSEAVDTVAYYAALDEAAYLEAIESIRVAALSITGDETMASDFVETVKKYYGDTYSEGLLSWLASLYEAHNCICGECDAMHTACYGSGFYYSNSARDSEGYYPDIISTSMAMSLITSLGLGSVDRFVYDTLRDGILKFVRSCQNFDGYFYHPQWGKESITAERREADKQYATILINQMGTPNYSSPKAITAPLGQSAAFAVSMVVSAASYAPHLTSLATYRAYLDGMLDDGTDVGEIAEIIYSQLSDIRRRDKELGTLGTANSLISYTVSWLDSHQDGTTGIWSSEVTFESVATLSFILGIYNFAEAPVAKAEKVMLSALALLTSDEVLTVEDVYNVWDTVGGVLMNIERYAGSLSRVEEARAQLIASSEQLVGATSEKLCASRREDGSFSSEITVSASLSYGMSVAVENSTEGDIVATLTAVSVLNKMLYTLGIPSYPKPFGLADGIVFVHAVRGK